VCLADLVERVKPLIEELQQLSKTTHEGVAEQGHP